MDLRLRRMLGPSLLIAMAACPPDAEADTLRRRGVLGPERTQGAAARPTLPAPPRDSQQLLRQAAAANPARFQFARDHGAKFLSTPDGRSFYVLWTPDGASPADVPWLVTLHGHGSWALDEFFLWQPYAEHRRLGIVAVQWWFGGGEQAKDYYDPYELYPVVEKILRGLGARSRRNLLHGFSRGAANTYALAFLDRRSGNRFFRLIIANAGGAAEDFPPNAAISTGRYGPQAFEDTSWVLFCGEQDEHPDRDGCPAMRRTAQWLTEFRGSIELTIEDARAGHGGFHQNPAHVEESLRLFDRLLAEDDRVQGLRIEQ